MLFMNEVRKNNTIDPNLERVSVPQRNGDDHLVVTKSQTPSGNNIEEDKKRKELGKNRPVTTQ